jgi:hypothetical protein
MARRTRTARKRRLERREQARRTHAERHWVDEGRIVCERCGLEQPFRSSPRSGELAPCEGPLGLPCGSKTAITIERYLEQ